MARVGIVMPTYGQGAHLPDALAGLDHQRYRNFELVVVVDGDFDPRVSKATERCTRIFLHQNLGTAKALNVGFQVLQDTCEFLTWVSSDNVMHADWLERLVDELDERSGAGAVYSNYIRETGRMDERGLWHATGVSMFRQEPRPLVDNCNCYIGPSFLYRAHFHHEHRGAISHDYDWWLRFEEKARIDHVDRALCNYRVHDERVTVLRRDTYDAERWRQEALRRRA